MGDSAAFLMHGHGFSYASAIPNDSKQGNPARAFGESVSFGRFTTESLSWERWSTFSHKKYVEEAERYSQPGSVAQKKAFFEAHYKRIAAQKAAALLEQENAAKGFFVAAEAAGNSFGGQDSVLMSASHLDANEQKWDDKFQSSKNDDTVIASETSPVAAEIDVRIEPPWDSPVEKNSNKKFDDRIAYQETVSGSESSGSSQMERPLLNCRNSLSAENQTSHAKNSNSVSKFDIDQSQDTMPEFKSSGSSQKERPLTENTPTVKRNSSNSSNRIDDAGNSGSEKPLLQRRDSLSNKFDNLENQDTISESESSSTQQIEKPLLKKNGGGNADEDESSATSKKKSGLSSVRSSIQRKTWAVPSTPAKPITPHFKKDSSVVTRSIRKSNMDSIDKKRSPPKSLRSLINLVPARGPSSVAKKTESAGLSHWLSEAPAKDCSTPIKTQLVGTVNGVNRYQKVATPRSEIKRAEAAPVDHCAASGSKTAGPKWHLLSSVCAKSLTACRNKLQSPTISTPFVLRTEERAAKRKQKLEAKFDEKDVQKVQAHMTLKEKAGNEIKKLSRSFCFKARPLPDFYREKEMLNIRMKPAPAAQPQATTVLGRSIPSKTQGHVLMPPPPSSAQGVVSKNLSKKKVPNQNKFPTSSSLPEENKSPNIQSF